MEIKDQSRPDPNIKLMNQVQQAPQYQYYFSILIKPTGKERSLFLIPLF
jgi:hypothetical protein